MGELVTRSGAAIGKGRISPALRTAITLIVHQGLTVAEAAQRTDYKTESLAKALIKPHVRAFRDGVKRAWLGSETDKAWLTMANLASSAASEDVRHKSAKVFLEAAGELDGSGASAVKAPGSTINIVINSPEQPSSHRLPGVVEYEAPQRVRVIPSNLQTVGRGSTALEEGA